MSKLKRMRPIMGTFVEITVDVSQQISAQQAMSAAFAEMETIDRLMSFHRHDSELTRLNQAKGEWLNLHAHTLTVLGLAKQLMKRSDGKFNCTVAGTLVKQGILPDHGHGVAIEAGCDDDIELDGQQARLSRPVLLTLDGIAKGYAVDMAVATLQQAGVISGCVNAGGDLRLFGQAATPIHRRELDNSLSYVGHLTNIALATSSVGEGYDARFPGMVVDESLRVKQGIWSVKAPQAWLADALTKVAAVANPVSVKSIIAALGGELVHGLSL